MAGKVQIFCIWIYFSPFDQDCLLYSASTETLFILFYSRHWNLLSTIRPYVYLFSPLSPSTQLSVRLLLIFLKLCLSSSTHNKKFTTSVRRSVGPFTLSSTLLTFIYLPSVRPSVCRSFLSYVSLSFLLTSSTIQTLPPFVFPLPLSTRLNISHWKKKSSTFICQTLKSALSPLHLRYPDDRCENPHTIRASDHHDHLHLADATKLCRFRSLTCWPAKLFFVQCSSSHRFSNPRYKFCCSPSICAFISRLNRNCTDTFRPPIVFTVLTFLFAPNWTLYHPATVICRKY